MKSDMQYAAKAAQRILGFYDTIPAADPKAFAAGLVEILSRYPHRVLDRAASPSGLASQVAYPNLAKFREHLDRWRDEYLIELEREQRANRKALPEPPANPEADARIAKGLAELAEHLKCGFSPGSV